MRSLFTTILLFTLHGCAGFPIETEIQAPAPFCLGDSNLPEDLASEFQPIDDERLLNKALGSPNEGKLCQGRVYKSNAGADVTLFRAWNSTNPNSKFGKWWAFREPAGRISTYRADYEICYQWSPLDKLVICTLKPETSVVVGTGQSAECSEYVTYPVSAAKQIYLDDASLSLINCTEFDGEFSWK